MELAPCSCTDLWQFARTNNKRSVTNSLCVNTQCEVHGHFLQEALAHNTKEQALTFAARFFRKAKWSTPARHKQVALVCDSMGDTHKEWVIDLLRIIGNPFAAHTYCTTVHGVLALFEPLVVEKKNKKKSFFRPLTTVQTDPAWAMLTMFAENTIFMTADQTATLHALYIQLAGKAKVTCRPTFDRIVALLGTRSYNINRHSAVFWYVIATYRPIKDNMAKAFDGQLSQTYHAIRAAGAGGAAILVRALLAHARTSSKPLGDRGREYLAYILAQAARGYIGIRFAAATIQTILMAQNPQSLCTARACVFESVASLSHLFETPFLRAFFAKAGHAHWTTGCSSVRTMPLLARMAMTRRPDHPPRPKQWGVAIGSPAEGHNYRPHELFSIIAAVKDGNVFVGRRGATAYAAEYAPADITTNKYTIIMTDAARTIADRPIAVPHTMPFARAAADAIDNKRGPIMHTVPYTVSAQTAYVVSHFVDTLAPAYWRWVAEHVKDDNPNRNSLNNVRDTIARIADTKANPLDLLDNIHHATVAGPFAINVFKSVYAGDEAVTAPPAATLEQGTRHMLCKEWHIKPYFTHKAATMPNLRVYFQHERAQMACLLHIHARHVHARSNVLTKVPAEMLWLIATFIL